MTVFFFKKKRNTLSEESRFRDSEFKFLHPIVEWHKCYEESKRVRNPVKFICSESTTETLEKDVKFVQSSQ